MAFSLNSGGSSSPNVSPQQKGFSRNIYISIRADGLNGTGSIEDPFNGLGDRFDILLNKFRLANITYITFHLSSGVFLTSGKTWLFSQTSVWNLLDGWRLVGAGIGSTIIRLKDYAFTNPDDVRPQSRAVINSEAHRKVDIEIKDLTIDGNYSNFGTNSTESFVVPGNGNNITVPVTDITKLSDYGIGRRVYIQEISDNRRVVGVFEIVLIDGSSVTLKNLDNNNDSEVPAADRFNNLAPGTTVTIALIAPYFNSSGIVIGSGGRCSVTNVRVTNVAVPIYEGVIGIGMNCISGISYNNKIVNCYIDNVWGQFGWAIIYTSNNESHIPNVHIEGIIEGNTIISHGKKHQGLGAWGVKNAIYRDNTVKNCSHGFFNDVGYNKNVKIIGNFFENCNEGIQMGGGYTGQWKDTEISNNTFIINQGNRGILFNGEVSNTIITNNIFSIETGVVSAGAISINSYNTSGVGIINNVINRRLSSIIPTGTSYGWGNNDGFGNPPSGAWAVTNNIGI